MLKYIVLLVAMALIIPSVSSSELYADPPFGNEIIRDGTIDLRILTIGRETSINIGIAGLGFRIDPDDWSEIDLEPTFINSGLVLCRIPYFNDIFRIGCD